MNVCKICSQSFVIESDEMGYYEKMNLSMPQLCVLCRAQRRLVFRNERAFYKRPCDKCHKEVISVYSPNKTCVVWCYDCWFADDWGGEDYARSYDTSRPFFEQWQELWSVVPRPALVSMRGTNCQYMNFAADNKNCYFVIESSNNENCLHCYWIQLSKDLVDCSYTQKVERSYESDDCYDSYALQYCKGCHACTDGLFLLNCRGCSHCVGCINLRQKQYSIFNEQYTKDEYEKKLKELRLDTYSGVEAFRKQFAEFIADKPYKYSEIYHAINSTGNYMTNVKNNRECFHSYDAEDNSYCVHAWRSAKDCMDCNTVGRVAEWVYNTLNTGMEASNINCGFYCWSSQFLDYCVNCPNNQNCFGCVGLRKKKYCILNKQYEKEEYEQIRGEIVAQMKREGIYGEFFPAAFSAFGYNESSAIQEFPLTREEALAAGFSWEDTPRGTFGKETKKWDEVPDKLVDVQFDIVKEIFACTECNKNYRIVVDELNLYKQLSIPLPRWCPECRHSRRMDARGPNKLWQRTTQDEVEVMTSYAPDRPEKIYSEEGYNKLVN